MELTPQQDLLERIDQAARTIRDLFEKHDITTPSQAKRHIRERFTQAELDAYTDARNLLDGQAVNG